MGEAAIVGSFDPVSFKRLQRDMKALGPAVKKEFNNEMRGLLGKMIITAKGNASWSTRIPSAIKPTVTGTRVGIKVGKKKAPHARAFEGFGATGARKGFFRHPVFDQVGFGRRTFVDQERRPFLVPAMERHQEEFFRKAGKAVLRGARTVGWTK